MNIDAAIRQSFGNRFDATSQDELLAQRLKDHRLIMSPHPEWALPEEPTWLEDPFSDDNWKFQYHTLRWLDPLRRQALAGDVPARDLWTHYVRSWLQSNPAGDSPTKWAWIDMGDALRAQAILDSRNDLIAELRGESLRTQLASDQFLHHVAGEHTLRAVGHLQALPCGARPKRKSGTDVATIGVGILQAVL